MTNLQEENMTEMRRYEDDEIQETFRGLQMVQEAPGFFERRQAQYPGESRIYRVLSVFSTTEYVSPKTPLQAF
jgi:hypothetical protein